MSCDCNIEGLLKLQHSILGNFNLDSELQGLYDITSTINGRFKIAPYSLIANFAPSISLEGIYCCIPEANSDLCFTQLDFSLECNSAHLVTAGF